MKITKRLTSTPFHVSKEVYKRKLIKPSLDEKSTAKVFFYGEINFIAQVGCFQIIYYYGIEFNRILN